MTCTDRAMAKGRLDASLELEVTSATSCPPLPQGEGHVASFTYNTFAGLPSRRDAGTLGTTGLRKTTDSAVGPQPSDKSHQRAPGASEGKHSHASRKSLALPQVCLLQMAKV